MPTFAETAAGYRNLWAKAVIRSEKIASAKRIALKIIDNKERYRSIEAKTDVPWFWIGAIHMRESSMSFTRHLHNGDPLTARTVHVPAGRPATGSPPFSFEDSAIDALTMPPHKLDEIKEWVVERCLYEAEKYNGFGYVSRKVNSPYIWAWTSQQQRGKFVSDGNFDPSAWDEQPGVAAILKALAELDVDVNARLGGVKLPPSTDIEDLANAIARANAAIAEATTILQRLKGQ